MNGDTVVTSYDYDAPLTESVVSLTTGYGKLKVKDYLSLEEVLTLMKPIVVPLIGESYSLTTKRSVLSTTINQDLNDTQFANTTTHTLDIIVENTGRAKIGDGINTARKGLNGDITIDTKLVTNIETFPLEFKEPFVKQLSELKGKPFVEGIKSPAVYQLELLDIKDSPRDTFIRLDGWVKGNAFINGFNIGRYYHIGPQQTLYIPAPLL
ncbi:unnamed protein product [Oppiella nova]|uniref:Beta-galactosidase n=1 Tax=Oppiella nova TaxID=334625 RepID=A0A7R9ML22_9ACAR|nr:unnamed protein product [Oppiella nova]CAG2179343.1 unnamed protein product [Oppiella nova]